MLSSSFRRLHICEVFLPPHRSLEICREKNSPANIFQFRPYPLHSMINTAFSRALNSVWLAAAIISGVGLIASFFMQEISMKKVVEVEEQTVVRGATTQGIALDTIVC